MSIKDLQPLQPTSPFYPTFIPTGSETPVLLSVTINNNSTVLAAGSSQVLKTQAMGIPLSATIIYFTVQQASQNVYSCPTFVPNVKFSDVSYSSNTGNMTWYLNGTNLVGTNRPVSVCSVYYYL